MMPANKENQNHSISLHEELQMSGQFSSFNGNGSEDSDDDDDETKGGKQPDIIAGDGGGGGASGNMQTCCKYSETETTSSSGFSDETSNKCTQTETFFTGSFLCTISDGDDCRFSIYDDASPIESRFRKTPEYRQLFREIFAVLKRAAEAKDEGERLPLLQDDDDSENGGLFPQQQQEQQRDDGDVDLLRLPLTGAPKVPPATPACEHNPLMSSIESAVSTIEHHRPIVGEQETEKKEKQRPLRNKQTLSALRRQEERGKTEPEQQQQQQQQQQNQDRRQRDIIEELASTVKHKKHVRHHHRKSGSKQQSRDISHLMEFKWTDQVTCRQRPSAAGCGGDDRPSSSHRATWCVPKDSDATGSPMHEPAAYASSASQEVAKLKLLEKSYAEVLRLRKPPSNRPQSQYFNRK